MAGGLDPGIFYRAINDSVRVKVSRDEHVRVVLELAYCTQYVLSRRTKWVSPNSSDNREQKSKFGPCCQHGNLGRIVDRDQIIRSNSDKFPIHQICLLLVGNQLKDATNWRRSVQGYVDRRFGLVFGSDYCASTSLRHSGSQVCLLGAGFGLVGVHLSLPLAAFKFTYHCPWTILWTRLDSISGVRRRREGGHIQRGTYTVWFVVLFSSCSQMTMTVLPPYGVKNKYIIMYRITSNV